MESLHRKISNWGQKIFLQFKNRTPNMEGISFNRLTSNKNIDLERENPSFKQALDFAIHNAELKNVAITGNYGSGKSSLLDSYEAKYSNKKFLHISLADYKENDLSGYKENDSSESGNKLNVRQINVIEGKIINQLLHQIHPKHVKKSIFKTLSDTSIWQLLALTFYVVVFFILISYFLKLSFLKSLANNSEIFVEPVPTIVSWLFLLVVSIGFFITVKYIIENKLVKSLTIGGKNFSSELDIFSDQSTRVSYFDRYLDDVLYLLNKSRADVIVFEDIDRFENNTIFAKIKELNVLVNNKRKIAKKSSKLMFLYLIRDDLFISKERTKFFDFIIPVLPVITSSNSSDKLTTTLKEMGIKSGLADDFLFRISLYIDDMRLLNNICNEFYSYQLELTHDKTGEKNALDLDLEKIFAMIVYKNIFPKDFSELQNNQGFLYSLFNEKEVRRNKKFEKIDREKLQLENELKRIQSEHIQDEIELYGTIFKIPNGRKVVSVNDQFQDEFASYYDFISEMLVEGSRITSYEDFDDAYRSVGGKTENLDSIFPEKDSPEFKERLDTVRSRNNSKELQQKIDALNQKRILVEKQLIAEIYTNQEIHEFAKSSKDFSVIEKNQQFDIIYFLLKNSYIDETYADYLTYFYGNVLTKNDKEFLRNISSGRSAGFDFRLVNISNVYHHLQLKDFRNEEVLNFDLVEYMLKKLELQSREENLSAILLQEDNLDFLFELAKKLYDSKSEKYNLEQFGQLMEFWLSTNPQKFIDYMKSTKVEYQAPLKNKFIRALMNQVNLDSVDNEIKALVARYINENFDLISPDEDFTLLFKTNLKSIDLKFTNFTTFGEPNDDASRTTTFLEVIDFIFSNSLYVINKDNLRFFMWWFKGDTYFSEDDFKHKNFELLHTNDNYSPLLEYSRLEIADYVYAYLDICEGTILDNSEYIVELLQRNEVYESVITYEENEEYTEEYLINIILQFLPDNSIHFNSDDFHQLVEEDILEEGNYLTLLSLLVQTSKAVVNTDIILSYFTENQNYDDSLIKFINNASDLKFEKDVFKSYEKEEQRNFFTKTVECMELDDTKYELILSTLGWYYTNTFDKIGIESSKLRILIDLEIIQFNSKNIEFFRDNYPEDTLYLIKKHLSEYLDTESKIDQEDELLALLDDDTISDDEKTDIADHVLKISIKNKQYSEKLTAHILQNQFDEEDLSYIISSQFYDNHLLDLQELVRELAIENLDTIAEEHYAQISDNLMRELIAEKQSDTLTELIYNYYVYTVNLDENEKREQFSRYLHLFTLSENITALKKLNVFDEWDRVLKTLNKPGTRWGQVQKTTINLAFARYLKSRKLVSSITEQSNGIRLNSYKDKTIPL
ncbi:hypothetical protein HO663_06970 [Streptococcus suis]|uniref:YobI family P-loop NTPase n=3 Tax=Streptococcus suis TaxID=1307 RepID=UPI0005CD4FD1|nr:membrane protein [Streptococcus suis]NQH27825.1 hypothetical protein [Streptococcus suis]NQH31950.1 hypothetical protein [Streptococcus suis]NQP01702.1 hypothetical protein [Streptococcus suis]NQP49110.1 hypothetical protein [Streptococcus suis]NQP57224.1 hypothetical protein [Streptococcus suis]